MRRGQSQFDEAVRNNKDVLQLQVRECLPSFEVRSDLKKKTFIYVCKFRACLQQAVVILLLKNNSLSDSPFPRFRL